ncbi:MAG: tetratricopeptide repeat protein [Anaerolineales bacterium]|nr:tetratricopeptide repeat protein [Anaerolineales bacterium]
MELPDKDSLFGRKSYRPNIYMVVVLFLLLAVEIWGVNRIFQGVNSGEIVPWFYPTLTPTRTVDSYLDEAEAYFEAGNLREAITAFQDAIIIDPQNAQAYAELARIQTYYSSLLTTESKSEILIQAKENADKAVEFGPENSYAQAVRALVYDWLTGAPGVTVAEIEEYLLVAYESSVRALTLDTNNVLALAYQAEILQDQFNFEQAYNNAQLALQIDPNLMDTHRVMAYVYESNAQYAAAIEEYQLAAEINPNFTHLYLKIGQNYRQLADNAIDEYTKNQFYEESLNYFSQAAAINETNGIQDPLPYIAISKTYSRQGEYFVAAVNLQKALTFDPTNADLYGQLGIVFFRSRNYEGSITVFKCAVEGCTSDENDQEDVAVEGLALSDYSAVYYYTYGSVLAALQNCDTAVNLLNQVAEAYPEDPVAMGIVEEGLFICK